MLSRKPDTKKECYVTEYSSTSYFLNCCWLSDNQIYLETVFFRRKV